METTKGGECPGEVSGVPAPAGQSGDTRAYLTQRFAVQPQHMSCFPSMPVIAEPGSISVQRRGRPLAEKHPPWTADVEQWGKEGEINTALKGAKGHRTSVPRLMRDTLPATPETRLQQFLEQSTAFEIQLHAREWNPDPAPRRLARSPPGADTIGRLKISDLLRGSTRQPLLTH
jgi:hypothetical protein